MLSEDTKKALVECMQKHSTGFVKLGATLEEVYDVFAYGVNGKVEPQNEKEKRWVKEVRENKEECLKILAPYLGYV